MTPATAAARRAAARATPAPARRRASAAPARRTAPARRQPTPAPRRPARAPSRPRTAPRRSRIVPVAVGRTASAVSGIADTGLLFRLTRGRLWIGVLTALLVGIVAINVFALSFGATASRVARDADGLRRANSALRAQLAGRLSDLRIQEAATSAGLIQPDPGSIRYVNARPGNAATAARRLVQGQIVLGDVALPATSTTTTTTPTTTSTALPATGTTTTTALPTTTTTAVATATTTTPTTATPTGGVAAP
jgi:hypothetical protein